MKTRLLSFGCAFMLVIVGHTMAFAGDWEACGNLPDITPDQNNCQIPGKPSILYEYGIAYNSQEPLPIVCTNWNQGVRIANKAPYFVGSDDTADHRYGGFAFFNGTVFSGDDFVPGNICTGTGGYYHRYWRLGENNKVELFFSSNGCYDRRTQLTVYCRTR